jgi:hypothetical protein
MTSSELEEHGLVLAIQAAHVASITRKEGIISAPIGEAHTDGELAMRIAREVDVEANHCNELFPTAVLAGSVRSFLPESTEGFADTRTSDKLSPSIFLLGR